MPRFRAEKCEDDQDATRMAEVILRELGYTDVKVGENKYPIEAKLGPDSLRKIARNAERIARWARDSLKGR